ncbi:uncharacterized protein LOC135337257 [Halichondria panicea]|uniref:uncharacterized protein LOC135337257 n=1 Tax=Halichondria panicea TaxID=6063 RepID=UPI00312BB671
MNVRWFTKNKVDVIRRSMLKPVREEAGLGSPPDKFYTNASETVNSVLKNAVSYKQNKLPDFILKLKEVCEEQEREVERAVVGRGNDISGPSSDKSAFPSVLSVVESFKPIESSLGLPIVTIEGIARKAKEILETANGIVPAPGCDDAARMTQSPFKVHFIVGNISVCNGCRGRYSKELGSPYDLCIQHEEWRSFTLPGSTCPQSRFGNLYKQVCHMTSLNKALRQHVQQQSKIIDRLSEINQAFDNDLNVSWDTFQMEEPWNSDEEVSHISLRLNHLSFIYTESTCNLECAWCRPEETTHLDIGVHLSEQHDSVLQHATPVTTPFDWVPLQSPPSSVDLNEQHDSVPDLNEQHATPVTEETTPLDSSSVDLNEQHATPVTEETTPLDSSSIDLNEQHDSVLHSPPPSVDLNQHATPVKEETTPSSVEQHATPVAYFIDCKPAKSHIQADPIQYVTGSRKTRLLEQTKILNIDDIQEDPVRCFKMTPSPSLTPTQNMKVVQLHEGVLWFKQEDDKPENMDHVQNTPHVLHDKIQKTPEDSALHEDTYEPQDDQDEAQDEGHDQYESQDYPDEETPEDEGDVVPVRRRVDPISIDTTDDEEQDKLQTPVDSRDEDEGDVVKQKRRRVDISIDTTDDEEQDKPLKRRVDVRHHKICPVPGCHAKPQAKLSQHIKVKHTQYDRSERLAMVVKASRATKSQVGHPTIRSTRGQPSITSSFFPAQPDEAPMLGIQERLGAGKSGTRTFPRFPINSPNHTIV